jgi:hypothetical protein
MSSSKVPDKKDGSRTTATTLADYLSVSLRQRFFDFCGIKMLGFGGLVRGLEHYFYFSINWE